MAQAISKVIFKANKNVFEGFTTIYCDKLKYLDINFEDNTIKSSNMNFFLHEFASEGAVRFVDNTVAVNGGNGQLMTHWANSDLLNMKFHQLTVCDNTFIGVNDANDMLRNLKNVAKKAVARNAYYQSK